VAGGRRPLLLPVVRGMMITIGLWLTGCTPADPPGQNDFQPVYIGLETRKLDDDLVNFLVEMKGARTKADVADYAECAAAQYALIRGFGFARHVRTNVQELGGTWRGDAVYTISPALPKGLQTIDAEVAVAHCRDQGIPTV
jgi:hypothetical protein